MPVRSTRQRPRDGARPSTGRRGGARQHGQWRPLVAGLIVVAIGLAVAALVSCQSTPPISLTPPISSTSPISSTPPISGVMTFSNLARDHTEVMLLYR